jgi:hypothetical protein
MKNSAWMQGIPTIELTWELIVHIGLELTQDTRLDLDFESSNWTPQIPIQIGFEKCQLKVDSRLRVQIGL